MSLRGSRIVRRVCRCHWQEGLAEHAPDIAFKRPVADDAATHLMARRRGGQARAGPARMRQPTSSMPAKK